MAQSKYLEEEISFSGRFSKNVFETILMSFSRFRLRIAGLFLVGILARTLLLSTANISGYWVDSLCMRGTACKELPKFFQDFHTSDYQRLLIGLAVTGFLLNTFFRVAISRTGSLAVSTLYDEVTMRTSRLSMSFFDTTPVGRIVTRFSSDYGAIFRMAGGPLGEFLCLLFDLILMFMLTSAASLYFLPLLMLAVIANYWAYRRSNLWLRTERRALAKQRGPSIAHFAETVQGAASIKVFGKRQTFIRRFHELMNDLLHQRIRTSIAVNFFSFLMTNITAVLMLVTGLAGISLAHSKLVSVGEIGVALTFIMMTSSTIQQFFEWLANLEDALTGIERMDDYLRRPMEQGAQLPREAEFRGLDPIQYSANDLKIFFSPKAKADSSARILVHDFSMRYRSDLQPVLRHLNFCVEPGEQLAIIGRTGSGKSSLIQALFSLYPPESGYISIGGLRPNLHQFNLSAADLLAKNLLPLDIYRQRMALIPQDPTLFRGSIRNNLVGTNDIDDDHIWEALSKIGIETWVRDLGDRSGRSLDFNLEEGAKNLSLGERQLLCIARALLQNTPIVIMDEATSSIDPESEVLLMRTIEQHMSEKSRIVVAHRLSTIEKSDRVLWLDHGSIRMLDSPSVVLPVFKEGSF